MSGNEKGVGGGGGVPLYLEFTFKENVKSGSVTDWNSKNESRKEKLHRKKIVLRNRNRKRNFLPQRNRNRIRNKANLLTKIFCLKTDFYNLDTEPEPEP
jgi:hypothetical protein